MYVCNADCVFNLLQNHSSCVSPASVLLGAQSRRLGGFVECLAPAERLAMTRGSLDGSSLDRAWVPSVVLGSLDRALWCCAGPLR